MRYLAVLLAITASVADAQSRSSKGGVPKYGSVYVSVMGEPFRATDDQDPFDRWFQQADENHDGVITRIELQNDADYFFAALDKNDDKVIDGEEMDHYEERVAPSTVRAVGSNLGGYARYSPKGPEPGRPNEIPIKMEGMAESKSRIKKGGSSPTIYANVPQPVAMADANLDRRVTLVEFRGTAGKRFSRYDRDHDGRLTRKELEATKGSR
ncbi:EF-hand domain-containing protein [Sphingomonas sp. HDW15A]|uniref:EF-hand domain-containing protein n=1 Tax=Sphingomonas sp. HDW15A TaxID=2714942 RepID=UPI00140C1D0B|nr:EF-hand domain-containing protein [Sphingomonas sp. HDW15A]QIK97102.1 EF-hand domain-containing protein [Sphingomonas sp. HDW15A]